jgi:predicted anti-sigma-YlaC factor YlaD
MKCEQFEQYFESGSNLDAEAKALLLSHLQSCKNCRVKFSPFTDLVTPSFQEKPAHPRRFFEKDGFWIFFAPSVVGLVGLSIFLILVR